FDLLAGCDGRTLHWIGSSPEGKDLASARLLRDHGRVAGGGHGFEQWAFCHVVGVSNRIVQLHHVSFYLNQRHCGIGATHRRWIRPPEYGNRRRRDNSLGGGTNWRRYQPFHVSLDDSG